MLPRPHSQAPSPPLPFSGSDRPAPSHPTRRPPPRRTPRRNYPHSLPRRRARPARGFLPWGLSDACRPRPSAAACQSRHRRPTTLVWGLCCQVRLLGGSRIFMISSGPSNLVPSARGGRDDDQRRSSLSGAITAHNLVFGRPRWGGTMMQLCASTAKLQAGGPNLHSGIKAVGLSGLPPPRIVLKPWQAQGRSR